jgi:phosphotransacetylase/predicted acylesterase/phospholipase RssA
MRAVQTVVDEGLCRPILIGRPDVVVANIERFGLRLRPELDFEMVNPDADPRYDQLWGHYHSLMERKGVSVDYARREVRRRPTLLGSLLLKFGYADGMICGTYGMHGLHLKFIETVLGRQKGVRNFYTMNLLTLPGRTVFLCDTYVNYDPTPEQVVEMTRLAADEVRRFGIQPRIALLSHSSFGTDNSPTAEKMRKALVMLHTEHPELDVEGEMHGDAALDCGHPHADLPERPHARGRQPADLPDPRCGQHRLQPAQDGRRRRHDDRPHPARGGQAGAHPHADRHRAAYRQHDGADGRRSRALSPPCAPRQPPLLLGTERRDDGRVALVLTGGGARGLSGRRADGHPRSLGQAPGQPLSHPLWNLRRGDQRGRAGGVLGRFRRGGAQAGLHLAQLPRRSVYRADTLAIAESVLRWGSAIFLGWLIHQSPRSLLDNSPLRAARRAPGFRRHRPAIADGHLQAVTVTASGYTSGESLSFFQGRDDLQPWRRAQRVGLRTELQVEHLMASSAIPFVFPAVRINREYFGDGSMRQLAPISPVIHLGAERILVIAGGRRSGGAPARRRLPVAGPGGGPRHVEHLPRRAGHGSRAPRADQRHGRGVPELRRPPAFP